MTIRTGDARGRVRHRNGRHTEVTHRQRSIVEGRDGTAAPRVPRRPPGPANGRRRTIYALIVFVLFLSYYFFTSSTLPARAGPDYRANNDVTEFIYKHDRLAVLPADADELYFSVYGGTRALRPPLAYIVSAATAKALAFWGDDPFILFRKGSSLLAAATVAIVFYMSSLYFGSFAAGLLSALLFGLLPQFAFIASYNNDDAAAIFSATFLLCVLVRILRQGPRWSNALLLGLAGGLVILSKQTAWMLFPAVLMFLAVYVRGSWKQLSKYAAGGLLVMALSGGWWIGFNVYHYGPGDPVAWKEEVAMGKAHSRLPPRKELGYASRGVRYIDLLLGNYDDFWGKTMASTIGNLDWMRLRVGPLQYGFYLALFGLGAVYVALRVGRALLIAVTRRGRSAADRDTAFEALLAFAILFQFYIYTWANMQNDIQLQGKYLLPVLSAALLLAVGGARSLLARAAPLLTDARPGDLRIPGRVVQVLCIGAAAAAIFGVHLDAIISYVLPFYRPAGFRLDGPLRNVHIPAEAILHRNQMHGFAVTDTGFRLVSDGTDPWFTMALSDRKLCSLFRGPDVLKARIRSDAGGAFKLYVDRGHGIREEDSYETYYGGGDSDIILLFEVSRCTRLRIDPANRAGPVEVAHLTIGKAILDQ
ncbi:MAG: glycosyltransferase family 39 protein [Arenicellales bacterium]